MTNDSELKRLLAGPSLGENAPGLLVQVLVDCEMDATELLQAIREVWAIVLKQSDPESMNLDQWRAMLPNWFVRKFGPEISMEEAVRRRALPMQDRIRLSEEWSLSAWVHWLKKSERHWRWWSCEIASSDELRISVVVDGLPFPSGSLCWLLKSCGASEVEILD